MEQIWPNKPTRFYDLTAMLPKIKHWVVQNKYDGKRCLIQKLDQKITLFGRQYQKFSEQRPDLVSLPLPGNWLLDGELLRNGQLYVWDAAVLNSELVFHQPYQERLGRLQSALQSAASHSAFQLVETRPITAYQHQVGAPHAEAIEGYVFKDPEARDLWGPHSTREVSSQLKYKFR